MSMSRRKFLHAGAGAAGTAALAGVARAQPAAAATSGMGISAWAMNTLGFAVPHAVWTKVPFDKVMANNSPARLTADRATWLFPTATAQGLWSVLFNVAWDNAVGPLGRPIAPKTHRKLARIVQQNVGVPQKAQPVIAGSTDDRTYHADLAKLGDQGVLSDGSKGYQQQQVLMQLGVIHSGPDQRVWVEVYQNSGQSLMCRFDGTRAPATSTRAAVVGVQAPSLMLAKFSGV